VETRRQPGHAVGPVVAIPGKQPDLAAVDPYQQAIAVPFEFESHPSPLGGFSTATASWGACVRGEGDEAMGADFGWLDGMEKVFNHVSRRGY
jgi:hypothetical protein